MIPYQEKGDSDTEMDGGPRGGGQDGRRGIMKAQRAGCYVDRKCQESLLK